MPKTCVQCEYFADGLSQCGWFAKQHVVPLNRAYSMLYLSGNTDASMCNCFSSLARKRANDEAKQILDAEIDSRINSFEEKLYELMSVLNIDPRKPKVEL